MNEKAFWCWDDFFHLLGLSSECLSQRLKTPKSVSKTVSETRAEMGLVRQTTSPENPDPQGAKSEPVDKTLISNIPGNRYFFNVLLLRV